MLLVIVLMLTTGTMPNADASEIRVSSGLALRNTTGLLHSRTAPANQDRWQGVSDFRARPTLLVRGKNFSAGLEVEANAGLTTVSDTTRSGTSVLGSGSALRITDLSYDLISQQHVYARSWIDRADVIFHAGPVDVQIGRQPISIGTSHFISVLDWVAPFAPGDLDATYKPGVDALRIRGFVGATAELEGVAIAADPLEWSGALFRSRFQIQHAGVEITSGRLRQRSFGGIGIETEAKEVEIWGEAAVFQRKTEPVFGGADKVAFQAISGLGYLLPRQIHIGLAGMYQDLGVRNPEDLLLAAFSEPFVQNWQFLASAGYVMATFTAEITPLVRITGSSIINAIDGSTLTQPSIACNVSDNGDLSFFAWIATGASPDISGPIPLPRSEFGSAPSAVGIYSRWFF